jgi:hypothetical protein
VNFLQNEKFLIFIPKFFIFALFVWSETLHPQLLLPIIHFFYLKSFFLSNVTLYPHQHHNSLSILSLSLLCTYFSWFFLTLLPWFFYEFSFVKFHSFPFVFFLFFSLIFRNTSFCPSFAIYVFIFMFLWLKMTDFWRINGEEKNANFNIFSLNQNGGSFQSLLFFLLSCTNIQFFMLCILKISKNQNHPFFSCCIQMLEYLWLSERMHSILFAQKHWQKKNSN